MTSQLYNKCCLKHSVIKLLKQNKFLVSCAVIQELEELQHNDKENEPNPLQWISSSLYHMHLCVTTIQLEQDGQLVETNVEVPSIIHKICSFLSSHLHTTGLFRICGSQKRIALLKEQLQLGCELSNENPHDVANIFCQLLRQLSVHLIPKCLNKLLEKIFEVEANKKQLALQLCFLLLPTLQLHTLAYVLQFFNKVAAHWHENRMPSTSLAVTLAPNLLELDGKVLKDTCGMLLKQQEIMRGLIDNCHMIGVVPSSLQSVMCPEGRCHHMDQWFAFHQSKNNCKEFKGSKKDKQKRNINDNNNTGLRKVKPTAFNGKGNRTTKRKQSNSDDEAKPVKRRSLQGTKDAPCPFPFINAPPKLDFTNTTASEASRRNKLASDDVMCFGANQKTTTKHGINQSRSTKKSTTKREAPTSDMDGDGTVTGKHPTSTNKRTSLLKKFTHTLMTPVTRRKSFRKRRGQQAKVSSSVKSPTKVTPKDETDVMEPIVINDFVTIVEMNNSSLENDPCAPPSPILPASSSQYDLTRDSFGCVDDETAGKELLPVNEGPLRLASSFDVLEQVDSIQLLDSSQKKDEYYETMLDAELEETKEEHSPSHGHIPEEIEQILQPTDPCPPLNDTGCSISTSGECQTAPPCGRLITDEDSAQLSGNVANHVGGKILSSQANKIDEETKGRVIPKPPLRSSSKICVAPIHVVEDLHGEVVEESIGRWMSSDLPPEKAMLTFGKTSNFSRSRGRSSPAKPSKDTSCITSGKVSAVVHHFNNLHHNPTPARIRKLPPLPYRDPRPRKGSFKMGKPSGQGLKLDIPTSLKLLPFPVLEEDGSLRSDEMTKVEQLHSINPRTNSDGFKSLRRRSRSADSIINDSNDGDWLLRPPSLPSLIDPPIHTKKTFLAKSFDFLDSSPAKRATPKYPRSRSPLAPLAPSTHL